MRDPHRREGDPVSRDPVVRQQSVRRCAGGNREIARDSDWESEGVEAEGENSPASSAISTWRELSLMIPLGFLDNCVAKKHRLIAT